jgi:CheY-like chemotaxis protein
MSHVLSRQFRVLSASNGDEALQILDEFDVDLLLTDVRMPAMDGLTLADHARRKVPHLPVAFVSAFWDEASASRAAALTPHILAKPIDIAALLERVNGILGRSQSNAARTIAQATTLAHLQKTASSEKGLRVANPDDGLSPALIRGDVLHVTRASEAKLRRDDVLFCHYRDRSCARRFLRLTDTQDAVIVVLQDGAGWEESMPWTHVVGRVACAERNGSPLKVRGVRDEAETWWSRLFRR